MNENACKKCKRIIKGKECSFCHSKDVSSNWKGLVVIINPEKSEIAKKLEITFSGKYALKTR